MQFRENARFVAHRSLARLPTCPNGVQEVLVVRHAQTPLPSPSGQRDHNDLVQRETERPHFWDMNLQC